RPARVRVHDQAHQPGPAGERAPQTSHGGHQPCQVLVVEDEPSIRQMVRRVLEKEGWTVREAENGRAGLQAVAESKPAVILLDLMMPVMNGFDFVRELRKNKDWQEIPVVILTAK